MSYHVSVNWLSHQDLEEAVVELQVRRLPSVQLVWVFEAAFGSVTPLDILKEIWGPYQPCLWWPKPDHFHSKLSHRQTCLWQRALQDTLGHFQPRLRYFKPNHCVFQTVTMWFCAKTKPEYMHSFDTNENILAFCNCKVPDSYIFCLLFYTFKTFSFISWNNVWFVDEFLSVDFLKWALHWKCLCASVWELLCFSLSLCLVIL